MNKKFLSVILFSALMVGTAGTFTSCKDYDDDIESLDNRVSAVEKLVSDLQAKIDAGSVITGVDKTEDGIVIKLSNGESYPIKNGTNAPVWSCLLYTSIGKNDSCSYQHHYQSGCLCRISCKSGQCQR